MKALIVTLFWGLMVVSYILACFNNQFYWWNHVMFVIGVIGSIVLSAIMEANNDN